jgi:hypothetical protein
VMAGDGSIYAIDMNVAKSGPVNPSLVGTPYYWTNSFMTSGRDGIYIIRHTGELCQVRIPAVSQQSDCIPIGTKLYTNAKAITSILGGLYIAADNTIYRVPLDTAIPQQLDAVGEWALITDMTNINGALCVLQSDGTLWEVSRTQYGASRVIGIEGQWANKDVVAVTTFSDRSLWYDVGKRLTYDFRSLSYTNGASQGGAITDNNEITRVTPYSVNASVSFTCFASAPDSLYLNLTILSLNVSVNGGGVPANITNDLFAIANSMVVVQSRNGTVMHVYAHVNETTEAINFKRSIASLLNSYTGVQVHPTNVSSIDSLLLHGVPVNGNDRIISETDVTGTYHARYSLQLLESGYRWARSKSEFAHYHPAAQSRARINALSRATVNDDDMNDYGASQEVKIDRMDNCVTDIIDGLIQTRDCYINSSILGDSKPLANGTGIYDTTANRVGGNSAITFRFINIESLACDPSSVHYQECFHSLDGYQRQRIEFEPVDTNSAERLDRFNKNHGHTAYSSASPLIRRIVSHPSGCYDRSSCTRLLPDIMSLLRATDSRFETSSSSLIRDIEFVANGGLLRAHSGSRVKLDMVSVYKTLISALISHGGHAAQETVIHEFENRHRLSSGKHKSDVFESRQHILLAFPYLSQPSMAWAKPLQAAFLSGMHTAALSLGLFVDRTGHRSSQQFLYEQHNSIMKQLHPTGVGKNSKDGDGDTLHDKMISARANLLTLALANIGVHENWNWLHVASSSTSRALRQICQQIIPRFATGDVLSEVTQIAKKLSASFCEEPSSNITVADPSSGVSLPFKTSAVFKKSVGNDQAGMVLDAEYGILAGVDRYLTLEASTNNNVHFNAHLFGYQLNIIDAEAVFDIRSRSNHITLVFGKGTKHEKYVYSQDLGCPACILECKGPAGQFGSGAREVISFHSTIMVGPLPIDFSVGLYAGYIFDYQFQFCVLYRPPSFLAGFGASASVYARASAGVSLMVLRGGISIDLAIFDGSLSPRLTLSLEKVCAYADLSISALSGYIDAYYQTRGCGPWYRAYSDWCDEKRYSLLSWNGPSITLSWPSPPCYPVLPIKEPFSLPWLSASTPIDSVIGNLSVSPTNLSVQLADELHSPTTNRVLLTVMGIDDCSETKEEKIPGWAIDFSLEDKLPRRTLHKEEGKGTIERYTPWSLDPMIPPGNQLTKYGPKAADALLWTKVSISISVTLRCLTIIVGIGKL